jgi:CDGSH-type Zn-finger protein
MQEIGRCGVILFLNTKVRRKIMKKDTDHKKKVKDTKGKIKIMEDGPYLVSGAIPLAKEKVVSDKDGIPQKWERVGEYPLQETYALCRCGESKNKPYCDGTHVKIGFDGTETADRKDFVDQAGAIAGPDLIMIDAENFCATARFCHRSGGTWNLTKKSDDPKSKEIAIEEACDCPSGRLVAWDKNTEKPIEPKFEPSISLTEAPYRKISGPLWVKGNIPIESVDGATYEKRNRVTLCRCGKSRNKPFCDGTHFPTGFKDGDPSIE